MCSGVWLLFQLEISIERRCLFGNEAKIREDVGRILSIGKNKGLGFILSTACSIAPNVPRKNVQILYELIQKYGLY